MAEIVERDEFDLDGRWLGRDPQPFDIGDRVVSLADDGSINQTGVIVSLGYADDYPFRVQFDDETGNKFRAWELVKVPVSAASKVSSEETPND